MSSVIRPRPWRAHGRVAAAVVTLVVTLLVSLVESGTASAATPAPAGTGLLYSTAGASCWGIKQAYPSSPDGAYWIQTPQLVVPTKVYCDMTTSGGGWELIGRGRNGWTWSAVGQGSPYTLAATPSGTGAFTPVTLSDDTVDGLLGGGRVDALPDGVQLRRATTTDGSQVQTATLTMSNRPSWSWAFGGGELVSSIAFPGTTGGSGNTANYSLDNAYNALAAIKLSQHDYQYGFGFGGYVTGNSSASSYLWTYGSEGNALPFTQVWIRPQLANSIGYPAIPSSGTAASAISPLASTTVAPAPWGVTGLMKPYSGELTLPVEAFAQVGSTMFVGGLFSTVSQGASGTQVAQPYLAGFDVNTGQWVSSFRPQLDGEVWDLTAMPNGTLLVGGEFTNANGVANTAGLAELDPTTGAVTGSWRASIAYPGSSSAPQVKSLRVQGNWVYVGGRFTRIAGPNGTQVLVNDLARVDVTTGAVDGTWKPLLDGTVDEAFPSPDGSRVYAVGYFTHDYGVAASKQATIQATGRGDLVPNLQPWVPSVGSGSATYQQATIQAEGLVWQGGSEHIMSAYNPSDYSRVTSFIAKAPAGGGGDSQKIIDVNGVIYTGCHCGDYVYSDDLNYSDPVPNGSDVNSVDYMYAVGAATQTVVPQFFVPGLKTQHGNGVWAFGEDSNQCLWFGGDFTGVGSTWLGGFGKVCSRDTTPPTAPTGLTVTSGSSGRTLRWTGSTDNSGTAPMYEVLRNDRVVSTTTTPYWTDPNGGGTYYVRAIDAAGNRSASTPGVSS